MWAVGLSVWFYRRLIRLYPRGYRRRFGGEQALVFRDQVEDCYRAKGKIGVGLLSVVAWADTLRAALIQRGGVFLANRRTTTVEKLVPIRCQLSLLLTAPFTLAMTYPWGMAIVERHPALWDLYLSVMLVTSFDSLISVLRRSFSERDAHEEASPNER